MFVLGHLDEFGSIGELDLHDLKGGAENLVPAVGFTLRQANLVHLQRDRLDTVEVQQLLNPSRRLLVIVTERVATFTEVLAFLADLAVDVNRCAVFVRVELKPVAEDTALLGLPTFVNRRGFFGFRLGFEHHLHHHGGGEGHDERVDERRLVGGVETTEDDDRTGDKAGTDGKYHLG